MLQCERGAMDERGSMCAQQGDSSWPKQWSLITRRLLLLWICQQSMIPDFFCTCRDLGPGLLRKGHLEKADGFAVGPSSSLVALTADGAEQPSRQAGI